jgi:transcriptional regulator with XRE-family HTH domain
MKTCEKLKAIRIKKGMSRNDLANKLYVTKQAIYKWETGKNYPDIKNLMKIAKIYGVNIHELLDETKDLQTIYLEKEGWYLMDKKEKENLKIYINWLPFLGAITSFILFVLFFFIFKIKENTLITVLYCLTPFFVFTMIYIPIKIILKRKK